MPTTKPRITITLSEHQHAVLSKMSALGKDSMSTIVVDMLDTMLPVLERVVIALQAAADAPIELRNGMVKSFEKAEKEVSGYMAAAMGQLDLLVPLNSEGVAQPPSRPAAAPKSGRPPPTNRGVRITTPPTKKPPVSPMKKAQKGKGCQK